LTPGVSVGLALGTGALILGVYAHFLPSVVDHRAAPPDDAHAQAAERQAAWTSAALLAGVSLLTGDETVFVVGAAEIIGLSWWHRYSDHVAPSTGKATTRQAVASTMSDAQTANAYTTNIDSGTY
jgi:hypothetical protein